MLCQVIPLDAQICCSSCISAVLVLMCDKFPMQELLPSAARPQLNSSQPASLLAAQLALLSNPRVRNHNPCTHNGHWMSFDPAPYTLICRAAAALLVATVTPHDAFCL